MPDFLSRPSPAIDAAFQFAGRGPGLFPPWGAKFNWSISMTVYPMISLWILLLTSATLFWVALTDLREFKVRNELVVILACLYVVYALFSGAWVSMQWNFAFALLMLAGGIYAYSVQHIGGGDLKLLTVAFLWTGPRLAAAFVILPLMFVVIYYVAPKLRFVAA